MIFKRKIILFLLFILILFITLIYGTNIRVINNPKNYTQDKRSKIKLNKYYQERIKDLSIYTQIPGLEEGAIPQGITYDEESSLILLTAHHDGISSTVIHVLDYKSGKYLKTLLLHKKDRKRYNGHAGGITIYKDKVYITSNYRVFIYKLEDIINKMNNDEIYAIDEVNIDNKGDFITVKDDTLFIGEYNYKNLYKTKKDHYIDNGKYKSLVFAYDIKDEKIKNDNIKYVIALPSRVQGLEFYQDYIILSRSFWSFEDSNISIYLNKIKEETKLTYKIGKKEVPLYLLSDDIKIKELNLPPMSEEIIVIDDKLYIVFESYAKFYRYYTRNKINSILTLDMKKEQIN